MRGHLIVGTSGFSYPHWRGDFYPPEVPQSRWLEHYASVFSAVELNVTFYRQPSVEQFRSWRERVPDGFQFVIKGSRTITHYRSLVDTAEQVERFFGAAVGLGDSLACVLWQLPPDRAADTDRLASFLATLPTETAGGARLRHAFEFRDRSWFAEAVYAVLRGAGAAIVLADPTAPGCAESGSAPVTADFSYLRFHGTDHDLGGYTGADLEPWVARARSDLHAGRDAFAFFNNDGAARAPRDARRFREALVRAG